MFNVFLFCVFLCSIAHRVYEDVPLTLPGNAILFNSGEGLRLKLQDSTGMTNQENKTVDESYEQASNPSSNYVSVTLNRQRLVYMKVNTLFICLEKLCSI